MIFVLLLAVSVAADLQCYVCTDCEFNYEGTATTCEDIQLKTLPSIVSSTTGGETFSTTHRITDENTEPKSTSDSLMTEEITRSEIQETTTHITAFTSDEPLNPTLTTTNTPLKLTSKTLQTLETSSIPLSTEATNTEYTSTATTLKTTISETTIDFSTREVSPTISILLSTTTEASNTTTLTSNTQTTSQTKAQEITVLPAITSTFAEVANFISTTEPSLTTSNTNTIGSNIKSTSQIEVQESTTFPITSSTPSVTEIIISTTEPAKTTTERSNSVTDVDISNDLSVKIENDKQSQSTSNTETPMETTTISSTFSTVLSSITDFSITQSTTNMDTTESSIEAKGPATSTLPTTIDPSSQTISTQSTLGISWTTEDYTESSTNSDIGSTMMQNYNDEPNIMMIDDTKKYGPTYRRRRAVKAKQDPRCIFTSYKEQNRTIVVRGCSFGEKAQDCNSVLDGKVKINNSKCFVCNTNLCNSASNSIVSVFILLTTICIVL